MPYRQFGIKLASTTHVRCTGYMRIFHRGLEAFISRVSNLDSIFDRVKRYYCRRV